MAHTLSSPLNSVVRHPHYATQADGAVVKKNNDDLQRERVRNLPKSSSKRDTYQFCLHCIGQNRSQGPTNLKGSIKAKITLDKLNRPGGLYSRLLQ